ncbi:MAG: DUF4007 family protein [Candidatus Poribacteria bacterium]
MKLQLSKGFYLHFPLITQLLEYVCNNNQAKFTGDELSQAVGLSSSQVANLCSMAQAMGLMNKITYTPTEFASVVWQKDRFFDDVGTLWMCHYNVSSDPYHVIWHRLVNQAMHEKKEWNSQDVREYFDDLKGNFSERSIKKHIPKEILTFVNAYTEQQFSKLRLLSAKDGTYSKTEPIAVPDLIFLAATLKFRELFTPDETALEIDRIIYSEGSPGMVFFMNENRVRDLLERLRIEGHIYIESRADLDQIRFAGKKNIGELVEFYYDG